MDTKHVSASATTVAARAVEHAQKRGHLLARDQRFVGEDVGERAGRAARDHVTLPAQRTGQLVHVDEAGPAAELAEAPVGVAGPLRPVFPCVEGVGSFHALLYSPSRSGCHQ